MWEGLDKYLRDEHKDLNYPRDHLCLDAHTYNGSAQIWSKTPFFPDILLCAVRRSFLQVSSLPTISTQHAMQTVSSSTTSQDSSPPFVPGGRRFTLVTPLSSTSRPTTIFMPVQVQGGSFGDIARYLLDQPLPTTTPLFKYPYSNTPTSLFHTNKGLRTGNSDVESRIDTLVNSSAPPNVRAPKLYKSLSDLPAHLSLRLWDRFPSHMFAAPQWRHPVPKCFPACGCHRDRDSVLSFMTKDLCADLRCGLSSQIVVT